MHELLDTLLKKPEEAGPGGRAFNIRVIPDLFTGEMLNVGVVVIDAAGDRLVRVIEEPGRLECLYGKAADNIVFLAKMAADAALAGQAPPSPNLVFAEPTPFWNMKAQAALESLFNDQVTVAIPLRQDDEPIEAPNTEALRARVYDFIRQKGAPMVVDRLIPQSPMAVVNTSRGPKSVRIPLQAETAIGGLESAGYSPQTVRIHLLDALIDLEFAADAWQVHRTGLFIARPALPKKHEAKLRQIDNAIDYVVSRAPRTCRVEVEDDPEVLAEEILDWAEQRAA
jgi:hypothetical protein